MYFFSFLLANLNTGVLNLSDQKGTCYLYVCVYTYIYIYVYQVPYIYIMPSGVQPVAQDGSECSPTQNHKFT